MSSSDPLLEILEAALQLEGAKREAYLQERCGQDAELLRRVRDLLSEDSQSAEWDLQRPRDLLSPILSVRQFPLLGARLGPWKLVRVLGEGGMGTVYLGERIDAAFTQQVAIKVIRQDVRQGRMLERFDQERHIHAALDHPSIAALLDAGRTPDGLPYLVMEFVPGERIDHYCEHQDLDAVERIRLFQQVCQVVQDVHQLGVLHRDLKPSNLVVQPNGKVKLLDFGVALVLGAGANTENGEWPFLTPAYASPECLLRKSITRASDQYSLGIILQELLTDRRPLLARSGETPGTDSTSGSSPGSPPSLGRLRRGSLAMYPDNGRFLRDLRAILSRSLDPDPRNRYATIRDLEQDLVCLLEGEAVKARPVGTWEGLRRKWSLYRLPIAGVGLLSLLLAGSLGYTQYKGKQYRTALQQSKVARADAEEHAQVMERFAREILTGLELRLRQVPNAYAIRDMLLSIGTQFFERDRYAKSIPEGLLVTVLDAYRNLALLRMYPMEGGGTRLRDAMEAFGKAYALIPTLEAANPQRGQRYRGLLLLDWGLAETDNLHLESGFQKLRQAQAIFDGAADRSQQPAHPEDALRTLLSIASNRNQAGEAKAAVAALDRLAKVESLLSAERLTDPFLEGTCFMVNLSAANLWWDLGQEDRARTLYTELHQKNWSHPSGNPNQDVISALGYINRLKLDWRMDPKAPTESLLNRLDGVLQGLLRADVEDTHYAEGVAQLYSLRARILNGAGAPRQAAEALEEAFRFWRFCIRADPDNASAKRAMTEDLLLGVDLARNEGASPARIQELREEARAYLEALKHLGVDHPLVAQRIRELDAGR